MSTRPTTAGLASALVAAVILLAPGQSIAQSATPELQSSPSAQGGGGDPTGGIIVGNPATERKNRRPHRR